jgi:hypothetical protein
MSTETRNILIGVSVGVVVIIVAVVVGVLVTKRAKTLALTPSPTSQGIQ